jgi:vacuolar iron transporter family protein
VTEVTEKPVGDALRTRPEAWVDFMVRFEVGLEKPDPGEIYRARNGTMPG